LLPTVERAGTVWNDEWNCANNGEKSGDDAIFSFVGIKKILVIIKRTVARRALKPV
jgi:hypothetical protein